MNTPEGSKEYPVEILSDDETCRYKIWDAKVKNSDGVEVGGYVVKSHKHHWAWLSDGKMLTNVRRCGTCGHRQVVPEMRTESKIPNSHTPAYHGQRTEQEP